MDPGFPYVHTFHVSSTIVCLITIGRSPQPAGTRRINIRPRRKKRPESHRRHLHNCRIRPGCPHNMPRYHDHPGQTKNWKSCRMIWNTSLMAFLGRTGYPRRLSLHYPHNMQGRPACRPDPCTDAPSNGQRRHRCFSRSVLAGAPSFVLYA